MTWVPPSRPATDDEPVDEHRSILSKDRVVCPGVRAVGVVESRAMMRRSSCRGGTRSSSAARFSI